MGENEQYRQCPLSLLFSMDYIIELSSYVRKYDRFVEPHPLT